MHRNTPNSLARLYRAAVPCEYNRAGPQPERPTSTKIRAIFSLHRGGRTCSDLMTRQSLHPPVACFVERTPRCRSRSQTRLRQRVAPCTSLVLVDEPSSLQGLGEGSCRAGALVNFYGTDLPMSACLMDDRKFRRELRHLLSTLAPSQSHAALPLRQGTTAWSRAVRAQALCPVFSRP